MTEYIVILNRIEARIFKRLSPSSELKLVKIFENSIGRMRNRDLSTDRPGRVQFRAKTAMVPHSMSREKNPHEDAAIQFVKRIARYLELQRKKGSFEKLTVAADSHLTGLLNSALDKPTRRISARVQRNLAKFSDHEIKRYFNSDYQSSGSL